MAVLLEDGSGRLLLEDSSGFVSLEDATAGLGGDVGGSGSPGSVAARTFAPPATFKYLAADLLNGTIFDEVPLTDVTWTPALNGSGSWSATIASDDPRATLIEERRTVIYIYSGTTIWWAGIVWGVSWSSDRKLKVAGTDLWGYAQHRRIRADVTYTAVDQLTIVSSLLTAMASTPNGDIGFTIRTNPATSGVARTQSYLANQRPEYGQSIADLAALDQGFDFSTSAEWVGDNLIGRYVDLWWPGRGQQQNLTWEHGRNCTVLAYSRDGTSYANRWDQLGSSTGGVNLVGTAAVTPGLYARFDGVDAAKDSATQALVDAGAAASLARAESPPEAITVQLTAERGSDSDPNAGWRVGDEIYVVAHDGWLNLDGYYRVIDAQYSIDNESGQLSVPSVSMALKLPGEPIVRPNYFADIRSHEKRLRALERR